MLNAHCPVWRTWSKSQHLANMQLSAVGRVATVSSRDCENDAVFRPNPNRPRSDEARDPRGSPLPIRIACRRTLSVIPLPSSTTAHQESAPAQCMNTCTCSAPAEIELSTRSAMADSGL